MKKIIVISGPSGVGKTTMYKRILDLYKEDISFSISATTRSKREGEVDGKDYHFLSLEEFEHFIATGDFIEWEQVHNNYYGTLKSEIYKIWEDGKHCLLDIDVRGGLNIQKLFEDQAALIFVSPPSIESLEKRLRGRGTNDEESLKRRLHNAKEELNQKQHYDYILKNDNLDDAILEMQKTIESIIKKSSE